MPPVFRHVFRLSAKLRIKYVWIDCLCIVQDEIADWRAESKKMGNYYQFSCFTIAAIGTFSDENIRQGLANTLIRPQNLARLPYRDRKGEKRGYFYVYPTTEAGSLAQFYENYITDSELLTRGWIFQEWILSRRIVCFTPYALFLQCQCPKEEPQNHLGEYVRPYPAEPKKLLKPHETPAPELSIKSTLSLDPPCLLGAYCIWEMLVEQYSKTTLSRPQSDRVIALSGVAGELEKLIKSALSRLESGMAAEEMFVAGLWMGDLCRGLLWEQVVAGRHQRLTNFPTWSWASVYTGIRWNAIQHGRGFIYFAGDSDDPLEGWVRDRISIECTIEGITPIPSSQFHLGDEDTATQEPDSRGQSNGIFDNQGDIDGCFLAVGIRGRLIAVVVSRRFGDEETFYSASDRTGHDARAIKGYHQQRIVTIPLNGDITCGWASVEEPTLQNDEDFSPNPMIFALLVSIVTVREGVFSSEKALNVLFLRRDNRIVDGFARIGVGRMFGKVAEKGFRLATIRNLKLV